jgi:hypothetical protein
MPEQGDPQVDTSYTGIIAQQAETIANLRTALENLLRRIDSHFGSIGHYYDWKEQAEARAVLAVKP